MGNHHATQSEGSHKGVEYFLLSLIGGIACVQILQEVQNQSNSMAKLCTEPQIKMYMLARNILTNCTHLSHLVAKLGGFDSLFGLRTERSSAVFAAALPTFSKSQLRIL